MYRVYRAGLPAGLAWAGPPLWARRRPLAIEGDAYHLRVECLCFVWNCQQAQQSHWENFSNRMQVDADGDIARQRMLQIITYLTIHSATSEQGSGSHQVLISHPCVRDDCPCTSSYNTKPVEYCCFACRDGKPCTGVWHVPPLHPVNPTVTQPPIVNGVQASTASTSAMHPCSRWNCPCTSTWD